MKDSRITDEIAKRSGVKIEKNWARTEPWELRKYEVVKEKCMGWLLQMCGMKDMK